MKLLELFIDLPKNFTSDLIELLTHIEMNGFDESMFSKNIISRYVIEL